MEVILQYKEVTYQCEEPGNRLSVLAYSYFEVASPHVELILRYEEITNQQSLQSKKERTWGRYFMITSKYGSISLYFVSKRGI